MESPILMAFVFGIVSACSFPLGALTSAFWKPSDRALAVLLAFGSGALLAALTMDLVGSALDRGDFWFLALGCILGSVLFIQLNHLVNARGGFLRKTSTTFNYIRSRERRKFKRVASHIGRIGIFQDLLPQELEELAAAIFSREYRKGSTLYRQNDPSSRLYIIETGEVEVLDPQQGMHPFHRPKQNDAFGRLGFLTGTPRATVAVTITDTRLWILPRQAFDHLLKTSAKLAEAMLEFLRSDEITTYLQARQGMPPEQVKEWIEEAVRSVQEGRAIRSAVTIERKQHEFTDALSHIRRVPIFQQLPPQDAEDIAACVFTKTHETGHTFFHQNEPADRMYIIERGEVVLLDPHNKMRTSTIVRDNDAFGVMSFLTGARHTVTAVAAADTTVWILRKRDFDHILAKSQTLMHAVREFLQQGTIATYLQQKHGFEPGKAASWIRSAGSSMEAGTLMPSVAEMLETVQAHQGAPLAIWLGQLLDGIPGALIVGTSLVEERVSVSLLVGLFLSNYPAALSSSIGMQRQGLSFYWALWMWNSLTLLTGVGAALGYLFFAGAPPSLFSFLDGIAVGAMLTVIAETMLPEAYLKGSSIVGFSTLIGFLVAVFFKTLE